jgi:hypothetical protein
MEPTATLEADIAAYEAQKAELEAKYNGKWVIFYQAKFVGSYPDFNTAAKVAVERFGRGPYLIRQVGAPQMSLPASIVYSTIRHATS